MSVFDGMAGLLNDVFGSPVTFVDHLSNEQIDVIAMFREEPVEVAGEQGGFILISQPTVRVPQSVAPGIERGNRVLLPDGRIFRIESKISSASPAGDRFTICTLELVT